MSKSFLLFNIIKLKQRILLSHSTLLRLPLFVQFTLLSTSCSRSFWRHHARKGITIIFLNLLCALAIPLPTLSSGPNNGLIVPFFLLVQLLFFYEFESCADLLLVAKVDESGEHASEQRGEKVDHHGTELHVVNEGLVVFRFEIVIIADFL